MSKLKVGDLVKAVNFIESHYHNMIVLEIDDYLYTVYRIDGKKDYFFIDTLELL